MPMKPRKLRASGVLYNQHHEFFAQSVVRGMDVVEAYWASGYKSKDESVARRAAHTLLRHPIISARIAYLQDRAADDAVLTRSWLMSQARATYHAAFQAKNFSAALKALEMLGRERNTFVNKVEVGRPGDFSGMTDE